MDKKKRKVTCMKCGYTWTPRIPIVKQCPSCSTLNWQEVFGKPVKIYKKKKCLKCGHEWQPRIKYPKKCPKCKNVLEE